MHLRFILLRGLVISLREPFIPHHAAVSSPGATPARWTLVLHGLLGSGANFRTLARRLAAAHPDRGFLLVDLPHHGLSVDAPPPFTIAAAAEDLARLGPHLTVRIDGVIGHSFGGKVALTYAARSLEPLDHVWVLDSALGARPGGAPDPPGPEAIVRMLRALKQPFPSRERFIGLVRAEGHSAGVAEWLATNVRRADDGFRLRLDLSAIAALLEDYRATDLWSVLEGPPCASAIHVVVAGRSDAFSPPDRVRIEAIAARSPAVHVHRIEDAGHWVHVDAPDALFALLSQSLRS